MAPNLVQLLLSVHASTGTYTAWDPERCTLGPAWQRTAASLRLQPSPDPVLSRGLVHLAAGTEVRVGATVEDTSDLGLTRCLERGLGAYSESKIQRICALAGRPDLYKGLDDPNYRHERDKPPEHKLHHRERQGRELLLVGSGTCGTKEGGI